MIHPASNLDEAKLLTQAIVNTIREPFLLLDAELHVLAASRSFYEIFGLEPEQIQGLLLFSLNDGQWEFPALHQLLETIIRGETSSDASKIEHEFSEIGQRVMLLNARKVNFETSGIGAILLAFEDVTERRMIEQERVIAMQRSEEMLREKQVLLDEMQHRVANSLQIIASILMLKARAVSSEETRHHLEDAHQRVMSVAAVQQHLHSSDGIDQIEVSSYLTKLCSRLAASMVSESQPVEIRVLSDEAMIASAKAVSLGLIVTELVINALKYAFRSRKPDALILVTYEVNAEDWTLIVADNGDGKDLGQDGGVASAGKDGLGTTIVKALSKQLDARMELMSSPNGLSVSVTRATFTSRKPQTA